MLRKRTRTPITIAGFVGAAGLACSVAAATPTLDFGIDGDTEYQAFKTAVRRAEYIRDDFLTGAIALYDANGDVIGENPNPPGTKMSVIGTLAATVAFLERNPTAQGGATEDFIEAFEAHLESYRADDPNLNRPSNFLAAMRSARIVVDTNAAETSLVRGFDADVADRALELLGVSLPEATSRDAMNDRVAAHERALVSSIGTGSDLVLLLTHALMNQNPDGSEREFDVTDEIRNYLRDDAGYESAWRQGVFPKPEINAAITALPADYAAYQTALSETLSTYDAALATFQAAEAAATDGDGNVDPVALEAALEQYRLDTETTGSAFQQRLRAATYGVLDAIDGISSEIDPDPLTLAETAALTEADVANIAIERRNDLRDTAGERASISANAILLYQDTDSAEYAERQLNLGSATVGANKDWANAKAGTQLGLAVISVGVAAAAEDPVSAYGFASDAIMTSLDLAENNQSNGVTLDDVYVQIREVQQQLRDMQTQLNARFDQVDQKLDIIFGTMVNGFDVLAVGQDQIRAAIDLAIDLIQKDSSTTSSLERTLIAVQAEELDTFFSLAANDRLGSRAGGNDFPYNSNGGEDDFDTAASDFGVFAAQTADDVVYTGDPGRVDTPAEALAYLDQADETLTDQPVSSRLNELIPLSALWLDPGEYARVPQSVVGPEPWSLAATAYLQLVNESPWYFNRLYSGQLAQGATPDLDLMIAEGDKLVALADAFGQTEVIDSETTLPLFEGLVANYKQKTAELQAHIDDSIARYLNRDSSVGPVLFDVNLSNSNQTLDLWLDDTRLDTTALAARISRYFASRNNSNDLTGLPNQAQEGYRSITGNGFRSNGDSEGNAALRAQFHSLLQASQNGGDYRRAMWYVVDSPNDNRTEFWVEIEPTANNHNPGWYEQFRRVEVQRQIRFRTIQGNFGDWVNSGYNNNLGDWADFIERMWPNGFSDSIVTGDRYSNLEVAAIGPTPSAGGLQERLRVTSDFSNGTSKDGIENNIKPLLTTVRTDLRSAIYTDMLTPGINTFEGKSLKDRIDALDDAEAILDAYVSIAFPDALEASTLLRSALHGAPPARDIDGNILVPGSEVGVRGNDVLELMERFFETDIDPESDDSLTDFGDPTFDLPAIEDLLNARIDLVYDELVAATQVPVRAAPYAEFVLAELKELRENYNDLAVADIFESQIEGAVRSVLANDTRQLRFSEKVGPGEFNDVFRPVECDTSFGPGDDGYIAPANGTLEMFADGTFVYIPDDGYTGEDYFTYRIRCNVAEEGETPNYAFSTPTWVRIRTLDCPLDIVNTGDSGDNQINAFDIRAYIGEGTANPSITGIVDAAIANDCQ